MCVCFLFIYFLLVCSLTSIISSALSHLLLTKALTPEHPQGHPFNTLEVDVPFSFILTIKKVSLMKSLILSFIILFETRLKTNLNEKVTFFLNYSTTYLRYLSYIDKLTKSMISPIFASVL